MNPEVANKTLQCEKYEKKLMELIQEDRRMISYSIQKDFLMLYKNQIQEEENLLKAISYNTCTIQKINSV